MPANAPAAPPIDPLRDALNQIIQEARLLEGTYRRFAERYQRHRSYAADLRAGRIVEPHPTLDGRTPLQEVTEQAEGHREVCVETMRHQDRLALLILQHLPHAAGQCDLIRVTAPAVQYHHHEQPGFDWQLYDEQCRAAERAGWTALLNLPGHKAQADDIPEVPEGLDVSGWPNATAVAKQKTTTTSTVMTAVRDLKLWPAYCQGKYVLIDPAAVRKWEPRRDMDRSRRDGPPTPSDGGRPRKTWRCQHRGCDGVIQSAARPTTLCPTCRRARWEVDLN